LPMVCHWQQATILDMYVY